MIGHVSSNQPFLSGKRRIRFEALQRVLVPRAAAFDAVARDASAALVSSVVDRMPVANQRKLAVFLLIIDVLSLFRGLRPFRHLPVGQQQALLTWLFDCPVGLLRKGFWGLNTLAKLGVYGQTTLYPEIGYRPRPNPTDSTVPGASGEPQSGGDHA